jgi:DNA-binding winged helix-turn-helix (wHTH) protein/tetratricopeptide (TPR) repeat protein
MTAPVSFRFGPYLLDRAAYRLLEGDRSIELSPKAIDLLLLLVERAGTLVTKDEILKAVWPDVAVTDNALTQVVSDLRHALGDSSTAPRYLETVPRRGYRFIAPVEPAMPEGIAPGRATGTKTGPKTIAVLDFANVTADPEMSWLAAGIAETVTNDLRVIRDLRVIDRALVAHVEADASSDTLRTAGLDLVVIGSFQRLGDHLRITARLTDIATREALANAKADGPLTEVFGLQDAIVMQLSTGLQVRISPAERARMSARETSSLDAYRALTEGRLKLEALNPAEIPSAIEDFERALALDPHYALAHVGLAHARFWLFQASRARNRQDIDQLAAAIAHARRAIEIDADLAEAHSALGFFLASTDRPGDAIAPARRAVALEPGNWRHLFRLGMAGWGAERISCLQAVIAQYPTLPYAYLGLAMLRIARRELQAADQALQAGIGGAGRTGGGDARFPASGLHALRGLIRLAGGDLAKARGAFERELEAKGKHLFGDESARDAYDGLGHAALASNDPAGAVEMFQAALARYPEHARSLIGLSAAFRASGSRNRADQTMKQAERAIEELRSNQRNGEAVAATAAWHVASGRPAEAAATLHAFLTSAPPGSAGWLLPVDPFLAPLRKEREFDRVLTLLADRAK